MLATEGPRTLAGALFGYGVIVLACSGLWWFIVLIRRGLTEKWADVQPELSTDRRAGVKRAKYRSMRMKWIVLFTWALLVLGIGLLIASATAKLLS